MNLELVGALNELEKERGIAKDILIEAIEAAIVSAYKRHHGTAQNVRVELDDRTGEIGVWARKIVVDEVEDEASEVSLSEAREIDPNYQLDDVIEVEVTPRDFGRIAAQTAKQVVIQRIREAERAIVYEEFSNRAGDVVTGIVQRWDRKNVIIDLGKAEAVLTPGDQMPTDRYEQGARLKVYISEVKQTSKGPQVYVSRAHSALLGRLFELEVPEIHDGTVEIKAISREAGSRSKMAVYSREENVDPVGACVGPRGMRVQAVVQELHGEKIDIVAYSKNPQEFIANALSPAKVLGVYLEEDTKTARAVVSDDQLSLAIGKEGQNARLAARLTGWRIDIKNQEQMAKFLAEQMQQRKEEKPVPPVEKKPEERVPPAPEEVPAAVKPPEEVAVKPTPAPAPAPAPEAAIGPVAGKAPTAPVVTEPVRPIEPDLEPEIEEVVEEMEEVPTIREDFDADLIEKRPKKPAAAAKPKKSRTSKKQELEELIEQELVDEDELVLPSLFHKEPVPEAAGEEKVFVFKSETQDKKRVGKKDGARDKDKSSKRVIKDLSALKDLLKE